MGMLDLNPEMYQGRVQGRRGVMDGLEGGGSGLQVPMASRDSRSRTCAVLCVGKSRVWDQVMQHCRYRLRTGVAVAVPVTSMVPEARVQGLRSREWESE